MTSQQFLSFNEQYGGTNDFGIPPDDDPVVIEALKEPMKLRDNWCLWEQVVAEGNTKNYTDATRKVTQFKTVQEFWGIWNGLPQPSELLEQKRIMREQQNGQTVAIDAIMIFKDGVRPEWEDPKNNVGGHFQIQLKPAIGGGQIDEYWNNVVLGMVGGTLEPNEMITGIRLVDKLSGPKVQNAIRIELWFTDFFNTQGVNNLKKNFEKCMCTRVDGSQSINPPKAEMKQHGSLGKH